MPATTYTLNKVLDYIFGETAYTPSIAATYYFGLSSSLMDATGSLTGELSGGSYARKSFANDKTASGWGDAAAGALSNDGALTFIESTADWGTILAIFIADTDVEGAGNVLWYYNLNPTLTVGDNTIVSFPVGTVMASMT